MRSNVAIDIGDETTLRSRKQLRFSSSTSDIANNCNCNGHHLQRSVPMHTHAPRGWLAQACRSIGCDWPSETESVLVVTT